MFAEDIALLPQDIFTRLRGAVACGGLTAIAES